MHIPLLKKILSHSIGRRRAPYRCGDRRFPAYDRFTVLLTVPFSFPVLRFEISFHGVNEAGLKMVRFILPLLEVPSSTLPWDTEHEISSRNQSCLWRMSSGVFPVEQTLLQKELQTNRFQAGKEGSLRHARLFADAKHDLTCSPFRMPQSNRFSP